ncbi:hypothetical protein [Natrinema marinum]|uniref:hypothetical protein n=1 Tax=Natrinema marinum TaxID=2961598 RepID=UPI0020C89BE0|nr:hypothetical protein [Natrinema marinum]
MAIALLLVMSLLTGAAQPAAAAETGNCTNLDDFVMFITAGLVNADSCSRAAYVEHTIQEMEESDANQTKVDIYTAASGQAAGFDAWAAPFENYLNDTESTAWMKQEAAVAEAYENGSTKATAKADAREAIRDYYSIKAVNLYEQWNQTLVQTKTLRDQAAMEEGISASYVFLDETSGSGGTPVYNGIDTESVTLPNGTTVDVKALNVSWGSDAYEAEYGTYTLITPTDLDSTSGEFKDPTDGGIYYSGYGDFGATIYGMRVDVPDDTYNTSDQIKILDFSRFAPKHYRINDMSSGLSTEASNFVETTYSDFDNGTINASDVISSHTAMFEYGVRSPNETEGLWRSTAALAMMGYDMPNLNTSGTMAVDYQGSSYTGIVMARNAPNSTWSAGTTYDPSAIDGPVFMLTTDGKKIDFSNSFTITSMTAKDGSNLQSTQTTKYVYKTANTSEMLALQADLIELRQEIEAREPDGSSSSSGGPLFGGFGTFGPVGLLAAAAAGLMLLDNR